MLLCDYLHLYMQVYVAVITRTNIKHFKIILFLIFFLKMRICSCKHN